MSEANDGPSGADRAALSDADEPGAERDPAETEPTDNSTSAVPDPARVAEAEREAAAREARAEER